MPSAGDGVAWDVTIPTDSDEVADGALEMREIKKAIELRYNKEHVNNAAASVGGEHEKGSAKAFYQSSYPTLRPDGVTTLDSNDSGRLLVRSGAGEFWLEVWDGTAFQKVRQADSNITAAQLATGIFSDICSLAMYACALGASDTSQNALGTNLGDFNSGAWRTRVLNTEVIDAEGIASLASNQITLAAGTYRVRARAAALQVDYHQIRFFNVTSSVTVALGTTALSGASDVTQTYSELDGEFTISATRVFELQHRCSTSKAVVGFGAAPGTFGTVGYLAWVSIEKIK